MGLLSNAIAQDTDGNGTNPSSLQQPETRPTPTEQLMLKVNLPATRLDLYVNGQFERSYKVAIGMPKYPTPIRDYNISYVIWNPWWIPPDSEWAQDAEKTPPGPGNPLGSVKLMMEDGIRIHGTNNPGSVGRASSHACLRMKSADIVELAWRIQQDYSDKRDPELLEKYRKNRKTSFYIELFQSVPVSVEYSQVEARDDKLLIHPDRYNLGGFQKALETTLSAHPQIRINATLLAKLKKLRSKGSAEISWSDLEEMSSGSAPETMPNKT